MGGTVTHGLNSFWLIFFDFPLFLVNFGIWTVWDLFLPRKRGFTFFACSRHTLVSVWRGFLLCGLIDRVIP